MTGHRRGDRGALALLGDGTKSLDLEHEIHVDGRLDPGAQRVLVVYNCERAASVPLSEAVRARLAAP